MPKAIAPFPARVQALFDDFKARIGRPEDWTSEEQQALAAMFLTNGAVFMRFSVGERGDNPRGETVGKCVYAIGAALGVETVNLGEVDMGDDDDAAPDSAKPN